MFCIKCGSRLDSNAKYCSVCGTPTVLPVISQVPTLNQQFCMRCGNTLIENRNFCPRCGTPVGQIARNAQIPSPIILNPNIVSEQQKTYDSSKSLKRHGNTIGFILMFVGIAIDILGIFFFPILFLGSLLFVIGCFIQIFSP